MMTDSRPRVSRRTLVLGALVVAVVTFVVLITEGILAFGAKTPVTPLLVESVARVDAGHKAITDDATSSEKSHSSSSSLTSSNDVTDLNGKKSLVDSSSEKASEDGVETSVSGVEACRLQGDGVVVSTSKCHACGDQDKEHVSECAETGRVEQIVTCQSGKPMKRGHRACLRLTTQAEKEAERNFLIFEAVNFGVGIAAYFIVLLRRKKLDSALAKKIEEQLASGV